MLRRIPLKTLLCPLGLCCFLLSTGCDTADVPSEDLTSVNEPRVSDVPLRIWVVAPQVDVQRIERQWLADSSQPIELESVAADTLLGEPLAECDVLIFPARNLGQAIVAEQIVRLPKGDSESNQTTSDSDDQEANSLTAVERAQVVYGSDVYAVSLGVSIPALVASDAFEISEEALTWDELLGSLKMEDSQDSSDVDADLDALVDRFLMVLGTLTQQNPNYGLLFEMQSMTPRLTKPEFIEAAEMLKQLSRQPGGLLSVLGSHDDAWKWVAENSQAVVAIAVPNQLSDESREIKAGRFVRIQSRSKVPAWNVGGAMVAALAGNCRQSEQALQFLQWLQKENTRNALQAAVVGVDSNTAPAGADQLSWRVRQQQLSFLKSESVPAEPSLPHASAYRVALGQALDEFVRGEASAEDALAKAQTAWEAITLNADLDMRNEYEKSLGLTL